MDVAVTFDYRCPFARNAHEGLVAAARDGLAVRFLPFSLDQAHIGEGETAVWDRPETERGHGVLPLTWGLAVRDAFAAAFPAFHVATFAIRHDRGERFTEETLRAAASRCDLDPDAVAAEVASGRPLATLAREHTEAVDRWAVFGVPTFIRGETAAFVRFMERGRVDDLERLLDLLDWAGLNELKHTRVPR